MCSLPALDQSEKQRLNYREDSALLSFLSTVTGTTSSVFFPSVDSLYLFPDFSPPTFSLSLPYCISSCYPPLPPFLLPHLSQYGKAVNGPRSSLPLSCSSLHFQNTINIQLSLNNKHRCIGYFHCRVAKKKMQVRNG